MTKLKLTTNFTFDELTDSSKFPQLVGKNRVAVMPLMENLKANARFLQQVRDMYNSPEDKGFKIDISSGYRCPELNKAVGSTAKGHMMATCADWTVRGVSVDETFTLLIANRSQFPTLKKVIKEQFGGKEWLHTEVFAEGEQPRQPLFYVTTDGRNYTSVVV